MSSLFCSYTLGVLAVSPSLSNRYSWALLKPTISAHMQSDLVNQYKLSSSTQAVLLFYLIPLSV